MGKYTFAEMIERAKKTSFSPLPPDVTCTKTRLPDGFWAYGFRHNQLGELGRIVLLPRNGETQFQVEVCGELDDPMTQNRKKILEPITRDILDKMGTICGEGTGKPEDYTLQKESQDVNAEEIYCDKCDAIVAVMVAAPDAYSVDRLEDYARLMFSKAQELNVPVWIVGAIQKDIIEGQLTEKASVLKLWPIREPAKIIYPTALHAEFDHLKSSHC